MSVMSNVQIRHARRQGHVVIEPYIAENVRKTSVDVTLGEYFYRGSSESGGVYSPFDEGEVKCNFVGPFQAKPYFNVWRKLIKDDRRIPIMERWPLPVSGEVDDVLDEHISRTSVWSFKQELPVGLLGIPADHPVIMLLPGEFILAHTHEFIGINPPGTTEMRARSSWGRNRVSVCLCAGMGDAGFINRWAMEMHNLSRKAIPIPVGERVAQIIFHESGPVDGGSYGQEETYISKYQTAADFSEVVANWTPEVLLPRNYMDERKIPIPLEEPVPPAA